MDTLLLVRSGSYKRPMLSHKKHFRRFSLRKQSLFAAKAIA
jgi:hypothetical protein